MKHRVAYTINRHQPVKCTHIGEDPQFYMDTQPDPLPCHGHAFCDLCVDAVPYHVETGNCESVNGISCESADLICNYCNVTIVTLYDTT